MFLFISAHSRLAIRPMPPVVAVAMFAGYEDGSWSKIILKLIRGCHPLRIICARVGAPRGMANSTWPGVADSCTMVASSTYWGLA